MNAKCVIVNLGVSELLAVHFFLRGDILGTAVPRNRKFDMRRNSMYRRPVYSASMAHIWLRLTAPPWRAGAGESARERPIPAPVRGNLFSLRLPRKESLLASQDKPECCLPLKQKEPTGWRGCPLSQHLQKAAARLNGAWAPIWRELPPPRAATSSWPCDGPELFSAPEVSRCVSKRASWFTWFADVMRASVSPSPLRLPFGGPRRTTSKRFRNAPRGGLGSRRRFYFFPSFHICFSGVWILYPRRKTSLLLWRGWAIFRTPSSEKAFARTYTHPRAEVYEPRKRQYGFISLPHGIPEYMCDSFH